MKTNISEMFGVSPPFRRIHLLFAHYPFQLVSVKSAVPVEKIVRKFLPTRYPPPPPPQSPSKMDDFLASNKGVIHVFLKLAALGPCRGRRRRAGDRSDRSEAVQRRNGRTGGGKGGTAQPQGPWGQVVSMAILCKLYGGFLTWGTPKWLVYSSLFWEMNL